MSDRAPVTAEELRAAYEALAEEADRMQTCAEQALALAERLAAELHWRGEALVPADAEILAFPTARTSPGHEPGATAPVIPLHPGAR